MRISDNGIKFISNWEGKRNSMYLDAANLPTIGIGHLIKPGEHFPKTLTDAEVYELFRKDVSGFEKAVNESVKVKITQNQFDALVSLAFNIGINAFNRSSVLRFLNANDKEKSANSFLLWVYAGGKKLLGLERRRKAEKELFLKPDLASITVKDNWYDSVMKWGYDNNLMRDGRPNDNVTRAELLAVLKNFHDRFIK